MAFIEIEKSVRKNEWFMLDLHSHNHYEIYFLTHGNRSFFLSDALYKLTAPSFVVIPPHVMHKTEGGAFERFTISVAANELDPFQKKVFDTKALKIVTPNDTENKQLLALLEEANKLKSSDKYFEEEMQALFGYIVYLLNKIKGNHQQPNTTAANAMPPIVLKIIDYLNSHYDEQLTLQSLADLFFLSPTALSYTFKKYTNCSVIDFLLNVRLTKAKELLSNSKKSVREISECCGFSSSNYFGLIFKKKEKLSPAAYRKWQREKV